MSLRPRRISKTPSADRRGGFLHAETSSNDRSNNNDAASKQHHRNSLPTQVPKIEFRRPSVVPPRPTKNSRPVTSSATKLGIVRPTHAPTEQCKKSAEKLVALQHSLKKSSETLPRGSVAGSIIALPNQAPLLKIKSKLRFDGKRNSTVPTSTQGFSVQFNSKGTEEPVRNSSDRQSNVAQAFVQLRRQSKAFLEDVARNKELSVGNQSNEGEDEEFDCLS